jgi:RNA recognition motif-containing protein
MLKELFSRFGEVESARVMRDDKGDSRKFGFVCFADSTTAEKCIRESSLLVVNEKSIFVARFVPRSERRKQTAQKMEERGRQPRAGPISVTGMTVMGNMAYPQPGGPPMMPGPMIQPGAMAPPGYPFPPQYPMANYQFAMFPDNPQLVPGPVINQQDREKLRQTIMEEKGQTSPLLGRLRELSDEQVKHLVTDQELLRKWYEADNSR